LYRITGIDWAQVNGMDVVTAQTVIAECGAELSAFPSEKQFTSWLGLVPTNDQSSGKILNRGTRKVVNRDGVPQCRHDANTKPKLLGRAISPTAYSSRGAEGYHRHGS
jgi:transposase